MLDPTVAAFREKPLNAFEPGGRSAGWRSPATRSNSSMRAARRLPRRRARLRVVLENGDRLLSAGSTPQRCGLARRRRMPARGRRAVAGWGRAATGLTRQPPSLRHTLDALEAVDRNAHPTILISTPGRRSWKSRRRDTGFARSRQAVAVDGGGRRFSRSCTSIVLCGRKRFPTARPSSITQTYTCRGERPWLARGAGGIFLDIVRRRRSA